VGSQHVKTVDEILLCAKCDLGDDSPQSKSWRGRKTEAWLALGWNKSGSRLLWFFAFSQEAALSPMRRGFFAFYKVYPQKRITAEIELIDKRNVQTYVDRDNILIFIKLLLSVGLWTTLRQQELVCTQSGVRDAHVSPSAHSK
jgi:hypothetical protein